MTKYIVLICLVFLIKVNPLVAATCRSLGDGDWDDPTNWSCGSVPGSSDDVIIEPTHEINLDIGAGTAVTVASILLENSGSNGGDLTVDGVDLTVTGDLELESRSDMFIAGGANVVIDGQLIWGNNGNIDLDGTGTGGTFLVEGCADGPGGSNDPANIIGGVGLTWCVGTDASCTASNSGESTGGGGGCTTLPITLIYFRASLENDQVDLTWATANEENNDYFTIEKSFTGTGFTAIDMVDGAGTSQQLNRYNRTDTGERSSITYYRLKQTDFNGKFSYSKVVQVYQNNEDGFANLFPNPAQGKTFKIDGFNVNQLVVDVYTIAGQRVEVVSTTTSFSWGVEGEYEFKQQIPGLYIVLIQTDKGIFKKKLIVK